MRRIILFLIAIAGTTAHAEAPKEKGLNENWTGFWEDCYDLNLPYFQSRIKKFKEYLHKGSDWEVAIETEKLKIQTFNSETCFDYGLARNDGKALANMTAEMVKTAQPANDLYARGLSDVGKQLEAWITVEQKELDEYGFKLSEFPCGKAMDRTKKLITVKMQEIEASAKTIAVECPKQMEAAIKNPDAPRGPKAGVAQTYGKGAGAKVPTGKSQNGASDISGIDESKAKEAKSQEKLKAQEEEAKKKNSK